MKDAGPMFDPATHYRIEVRGPVDVEWLRSFDISAEVIVDETAQMGETTLLEAHTDQSGLVGLVRRLHQLGMTILQIQIVSEEDDSPQVQADPKG